MSQGNTEDPEGQGRAGVPTEATEVEFLLVWRCSVQLDKTSTGSCPGSVSGWRETQSLRCGP